MTGIIAEIGINHNGNLNIAKRLIEVAASAGCDYVKLQKRTPEICTPEDMKHAKRETPWGTMEYLDYRRRLEFGRDEYDEINGHCGMMGIKWIASAWDRESLRFLERYDLDFIKVPSAMLTDDELLEASPLPLMMSTGMSDVEMIDHAVTVVGREKVHSILHCTSTYPSKAEELNLNCIPALIQKYPWASIGFSNHHPGLIYMPVAVALGAEWIEFHVTLDRAMWGTDQAASIEPEGIHRLVKWIRGIDAAMGDGVKRIYESELPIMKKLRRLAS